MLCLWDETFILTLPSQKVQAAVLDMLFFVVGSSTTLTHVVGMVVRRLRKIS